MIKSQNCKNKQRMDGIMSLKAKTTVTVFLKTVLLGIMILIINVSLIALGICITKPKAGYTVYHSTDGGKTKTEVYTYYYKDGKDTQIEKYKNNSEYYKAEIAGGLEQKYLNYVNIATAVCGMVLTVVMFYKNAWILGDKFQTKYELSNEKYDKLFMLKCSVLAGIPYALLYLALIITKLMNKSEGFVKAYRLLNFHFFYYIDLFLKGDKISYFGILALAAMLLPIPIICYLGFKLGTKHLYLKNNIMYKNQNNTK